MDTYWSPFNNIVTSDDNRTNGVQQQLGKFRFVWKTVNWNCYLFLGFLKLGNASLGQYTVTIQIRILLTIQTCVLLKRFRLNAALLKIHSKLLEYRLIEPWNFNWILHPSSSSWGTQALAVAQRAGQRSSSTATCTGRWVEAEASTTTSRRSYRGALGGGAMAARAGPSSSPARRRSRCCWD